MDKRIIQVETIRIRHKLRQRQRMDGKTTTINGNTYNNKNILDMLCGNGIIKMQGEFRGDDDPDAWVTLENGAHIPLNENGEAMGGAGGWAKGKDFSDAESTETTARGAGSKVGEVTSGKAGNFKPKHEGARAIDTADAMEEVAKGKHNSLEEHMDEHGNLSPERQAVHDKIIQDFFADKEAYEGQPSLVMSGGGPASGKTFIREEAEKDFGKNTTVTIDPDQFKQRLPGYTEMAKKDESAAGFYHEESSALAKRAYQYAADNGVNVVYDGTGDGSVRSVEGKLNIARDAGYKVKGSYVTVDTDEALRRNQARYENAKAKYDAGKSDTPPRLPPPDVVKETHQKVSDISLQVADKFDDFELYDNNGPRGSSPVKIATCKKGGDIVAVKGKERELQKYLDKGKSGAKVVNGKVRK